MQRRVCSSVHQISWPQIAKQDHQKYRSFPIAVCILLGFCLKTMKAALSLQVLTFYVTIEAFSDLKNAFA